MSTGNSLNENFIAAVDLGSQKISLAVARVEGKSTQILFYRTAPSEGIMESDVSAPGKTSIVVKTLIEEAESELNIKIRQVVANLPRCNIRQDDATGTATRINPDDCITSEEVEAIKDMAQQSSKEKVADNEKIYGVIAQSFSTGDYFQLIENDVIGMTGDSITGHFKVFIGRKRPAGNIDKVFNDLGIGLARTYFSPLAAAKAVLTEEETGNGVALIDLGAGSTSVSIFVKKVLSWYGAIPFGGNTVTGDIRNVCGISESMAENIKLGFGGCIPEKLLTLSDKIIQIETDDMSAYTQIPVNYLSDVISARMKEIIDAMLYFIQESKLANDLRKGIVITGGGAEMLNIANYIKELSGYNVRVAYPRHGFVAPNISGIISTKASTVTGMILMARDEGLNCCTDLEDRNPEINSNDGEVNTSGNEGGDNGTPAPEHSGNEVKFTADETEQEEKKPEEEKKNESGHKPAEEKKTETEKKDSKSGLLKNFLFTFKKVKANMDQVIDNASNEINNERL